MMNVNQVVATAAEGAFHQLASHLQTALQEAASQVRLEGTLTLDAVAVVPVVPDPRVRVSAQVVVTPHAVEVRDVQVKFDAHD